MPQPNHRQGGSPSTVKQSLLSLCTRRRVSKVSSRQGDARSPSHPLPSRTTLVRQQPPTLGSLLTLGPTISASSLGRSSLQSNRLRLSDPLSLSLLSRFQEQDTRLQKLESAVQALQTGQEDQARQSREDKEAMAGSLSSMQAHFTASLEAMQAAQQRQQEQLCQGMAELKSIVLAVSQPDQSKKPRLGYREPMELDGSNAH